MAVVFHCFVFLKPVFQMQEGKLLQQTAEPPKLVAQTTSVVAFIKVTRWTA